MLKRLTASVLLLCFGLFSLELLIADVHDGDAPAAEVASPPIRSAALDASEQASTSIVLSSADRSGDEGDSDAPSGSSRHAVHACHCVHVHGVSVATVASLPPLPEAGRVIIRDVTRTPDQVDLDVHLRPPIA